MLVLRLRIGSCVIESNINFMTFAFCSGNIFVRTADDFGIICWNERRERGEDMQQRAAGWH